MNKEEQKEMHIARKCVNDYIKNYGLINGLVMISGIVLDTISKMKKFNLSKNNEQILFNLLLESVENMNNVADALEKSEE